MGWGQRSMHCLSNDEKKSSSTRLLKPSSGLNYKLLLHVNGLNKSFGRHWIETLGLVDNPSPSSPSVRPETIHISIIILFDCPCSNFKLRSIPTTCLFPSSVPHISRHYTCCMVLSPIFIHISIYLSNFYLFAYTSIYPHIYLSSHVYIYIHTYIWIYLSIHE